MQYMGSKAKLAKQILPIILQDRKPNQWYVEPFVGGANLIIEVEGKRIGSDVHEYLMALHKALQVGWKPPVEISEKLYYHIRENKHLYDDYLVGFVGFLCAFGSKWFSSYATNQRGDNFSERGSRLMIEQAKKYEGIVFKNVPYDELIIPPNSLIYCDPPYEGTAKYSTGNFDHTKFWQWCRDKSDEGHTVYISEYNAPDDFILCLEINHFTTLNNKNNKSKRTEKLFTYL